MDKAFDGVFSFLGLNDWCSKGSQEILFSLSDLATTTSESSWWKIPFPSLDNLHSSCKQIPNTVDLAQGIEHTFLDVRESIQLVLDPITSPLSWLIDSCLYILTSSPWWLIVIVVLTSLHYVCKSVKVVVLTAITFLFFLILGYFSHAMQTLAIVLACSFSCLVIGVPAGVAVAKIPRARKIIIPILDTLQTLPHFVYLIFLIFLFDLTESRLYGIAIILYSIAPIIRLTDLGITRINKQTVEAADSFGMTPIKVLIFVELRLALPSIMTGINQTIMMSLTMVVVAALVAAPGLGLLVYQGISGLNLGIGILSGMSVVLLAIMVDRVSNAVFKHYGDRKKSIILNNEKYIVTQCLSLIW